MTYTHAALSNLVTTDPILLHCKRILRTHPVIGFVVVDSRSYLQLADDKVFVAWAYAEGCVPGNIYYHDGSAVHYRPAVSDGVCERESQITYGVMWRDYIAWKVCQKLGA